MVLLNTKPAPQVTAGSNYVSFAGFFGFAAVVLFAVVLVGADLADFGSVAFLCFTSDDLADFIIVDFLEILAEAFGAVGFFAAAAVAFGTCGPKTSSTHKE